MLSQFDYQIRFPEKSNDIRNQEYFYVVQNGHESRYNLQHYKEVFAVPGLYNAVTSKLRYQSPETIAMQLVTQLIKYKAAIDSLVVLDIAAGTGLIGKHLTSLGVKSIVGVDIIEEAAQATQRDHPGAYEKYYVEDLTNISFAAQKELTDRGFNCLVCCSSLSCHFPIQGFINAFNLIKNGGWIAFNVNTYILEDTDSPDSFEYQKAAEFGQLYHHMVKTGILEITNKHYYLHRLLTNGKALDYVSVTARKRSNISEGIVNLADRFRN
ncbi:MAG: class I SAM-dependent methyltransferase [Leptolyngbya sp. SIO1D8]|nr:class I SAM-dependent methyltransferase [Leptolyngbya sp. SIO1D8]